MTATRDYDGTVTDLEDRANVPSLEGLHHERRQILEEWKVLKALHGPGDKWQNRRKAFLEARKLAATMIYEETKKTKPPEWIIDMMGHADEAYIKFVEDGIAAAARYEELSVLKSEIEERIFSRNIELSAYSSEARLGR